MRKRLTKVGDAQAVLLSEETLERLGVQVGGELEMQVHGRVLALHAPDLESEEVRTALAFRAVLAEDEEVLERLADA